MIVSETAESSLPILLDRASVEKLRLKNMIADLVRIMKTGFGSIRLFFQTWEMACHSRKNIVFSSAAKVISAFFRAVLEAEYTARTDGGADAATDAGGANDVLPLLGVRPHIDAHFAIG